MRRPLASCALAAVLLAASPALPALPAAAGQAVDRSPSAGFWAGLVEAMAAFFGASGATTGPDMDPNGLQTPAGSDRGPDLDPNGLEEVPPTGDRGPHLDPDG